MIIPLYPLPLVNNLLPTTMYDETPAQSAALAILVKQGFEFSNWISAHDGDPDHGCMVCTRRPRRGTTEYREIDPEGNVN